jgi:hypothetical protein
VNASNTTSRGASMVPARPRVDRPRPAGVQAVQPLPARPAHPYEPDLAQHPQVLGRLWLGRPQFPCRLGPGPARVARGRTLGGVSELDAEDLKIITLARSTRARAGAAEGAAVRDETGRTYAAGPVDLPSLKLTALQVAVAMAVSSGAEDVEAAAVVTDDETPDIAAVRDLGPAAPVLVAGPDGALRTVLRG